MQRSLAARIVQGSRKSQRSEIFGKRRSGGARERRPAGAARGSSRPRRRGPRRSWNDRCSLQLIFRGVAQFGSALGSGPRGRGFKSRHLDHEKAKGFALRFFLSRTEPTTSSLLQGSRKSQRSEIFGNRRSGARTRAPPRRGGARERPTATTRVQVPSPRPRKSEGFCPSLFCITNALAGGKGAMKQKSKKSYFLRRSAAETARARKAARIQRTRSFGI